MTPRERSKQIIAKIGRYSSSAEILALIEPAIIAAIKEEREACAKVLEDAAITRWEQGTLTHYAELIRARSRNDLGEPVELIGAIRDDE